MNNDVFVYNTNDVVKIKEPELPVFELVKETDPILNKVMPEFDFNTSPVDPNNFASRLVETCKKRNGFGLSANQCGFNYRVFVMGSGEEYVAMFNPKIIGYNTDVNGNIIKSKMVEGCLSFPLLALKVERCDEITISYQDFTGKSHQTNLTGMSAHVFQNELDHLDGISFTKRAGKISLKMGLTKRRKFDRIVTRYEKSKKILENVLIKS